MLQQTFTQGQYASSHDPQFGYTRIYYKLSSKEFTDEGM